MEYPVLHSLDNIAELRKLSISELNKLTGELRDFLQVESRVKEGHIRSSLGVTELTLALHYVFNTPQDILIWDVGHQAYIHKILTDRKAVFHTNRKLKGISGFTKRSESEFDPFGAGHSSTSISAALGFAMAAQLRGVERKHIAVIGDGALTGGESFEALNYLGQEQLDVIVVLNDNESSIDPNVGALSQYGKYQSLCEALHIEFCGEINGHNVEELVHLFSSLQKKRGPLFIRVKTEKGKGWKGSSQIPVTKKTFSFQQGFSSTLINLAKSDPNIVAVSPAMISGSGLDKFQAQFPERTFDVGIAEQHAVTMSAALAADGLKPFCHLYSTFAQRAYDQIIHDVALQDLPVIFCLDRAGLAGEDGPTHHGSFDVSFLMAIPNMVISAPMDLGSLTSLMKAALSSKKPFSIRYPKAIASEGTEEALPVGKLRNIKKGSEKAVLSFGSIGEEVSLALKDLHYSHYDIVYLKPLDEVAVRQILRDYSEVITVEENSFSGGLGQVLETLKSRFGSTANLRHLSLPDVFVEHGSREELLAITGLDHDSIKEFIQKDS